MFRRTGRRARLMEIPLDGIRPGAQQARELFDPQDLEELVASIREMGVLQPVVVRKTQSGYELVAGERRWRAARVAGLATIPALVQDFDETEAFLAGIVENLQRSDLSPLEEASGLRRLLTVTGLTQEEVARRIGKSQSAVANKLRLLKLGPAVKDLARDTPEQLTERHLRALLRLEDWERQAEIAKKAVQGQWTVKELEARVEAAMKPAKRRGHRVGVVTDVRIVLNSFRRSVATLVESGLSAEIEEEDLGDAIAVTIRIPKKRVRERA